MAVYAAYPFACRRFANRRFEALGVSLRHFVHHYNVTWRNERCVEIACALHFLKEWEHSRVLEVGNVLSYYSDHAHCVSDKYEQSPGVLGIDFLDFKPENRFDSFISVSTFEHIGWDESPRTPGKVERALFRIRELVLNPERVFLALPLGYNQELDDLLIAGRHPFARAEYLVRVDKEQHWDSVPLAAALAPKHRYNARFEGASALALFLGLNDEIA
ncbi:hypothetical protein [Thiohalocapsa sp. ML1]|uniref:hypothetical protein n=1 Tax=Thiohalocapsa sp. ML1 TaxID=1431688 RepID=UPI0012E3AD7D|nr:hypothetical protein [Thiohalocapsa sp. ML1]